MIAVIVPAHNEAQLIGACLQSLQRAARHVALDAEEVRILVGLDRCNDATGAVCARFGIETLALNAGCVGATRAHLAHAALAQGARWISCTDADTTVPDDWFAAQLACGADAFCGVVQVSDWEGYSPVVRRQFARSEHARNGHRHVHGANMGFSAGAYLRSGGFQSLSCGEDVALINAMERAGCEVAWLGTPRVITSARREARAPHGFSHFLKRLEAAHGRRDAAHASPEPEMPAALDAPATPIGLVPEWA